MNDTLQWQSEADTRYNQRILLLSPFVIAINRPTADNQTLSVSATVTALESFDRKVVVQVVVVDTSVLVNGTVYYNAVRKMLPDATGTFRADSWAAGDSQKLDFTWNYGNLDPSGFKVVVFVQDYETREVYQVQQTTRAVRQRAAVTGLTNAPGLLSAKMFPNPVLEGLQVVLPPEFYSGNQIKWRVVSMQGQTLRTGHWQARRTS